MKSVPGVARDYTLTKAMVLRYVLIAREGNMPARDKEATKVEVVPGDALNKTRRYP